MGIETALQPSITITQAQYKELCQAQIYLNLLLEAWTEDAELDYNGESLILSYEAKNMAALCQLLWPEESESVRAYLLAKREDEEVTERLSDMWKDRKASEAYEKLREVNEKLREANEGVEHAKDVQNPEG